MYAYSSSELNSAKFDFKGRNQQSYVPNYKQSIGLLMLLICLCFPVG